MSQTTYLRILKAGIWLAFLSVFLVFKNLLFPYISSKQIYFNIVVEILFVIWLAFIIKFPEARPKRSWITIGLCGFFGSILLSSIFGVNFNLSMWGNVERMLGFFQLIHFLAFYLIVITVMRTWEDWRNVFLVSTVCAFFVSLDGIGQKMGLMESPWNTDRIIATIGNSAYVGAYAIFNLYFCLILAWKENNWGIRSLHLLNCFVIFLAMIFSGTRGSYIGFLVSILVMLFLFGILNQSKKIKFWSMGIFLFFGLIVGLLFVNANKPFVTNNLYLNRFAHISFTDATMQTRFISWKAAYKDFHNHPILGTGHGNYAITFDKYFDPKFLTFTSSETYFDRAHNNLIDITSTSGLLGLITYLFVFAASFYYLITGYRRKKIETGVFIILVCLIVAYFIQNLVVFDALVTYVALMVMLGYIYWLSRDEEYQIIKSSNSPVGFTNKEFYAFLIAGLIMIAIIYQYNIKAWNMLTDTIESQQYISRGDLVSAYEAFKRSQSYNTIMEEDSRSTFISAVTSNISALNNIDRKKATDIIDYAVSLSEKNIKNNPQDSLNQMKMALLLDTISKFYFNDAEKFNFYSKWAEDSVNKSIDASPGRVPIYFNKAQIFLSRGQKDKALETLKYAINLNPDFSQSYCYLGRVQLFYKNEKEGYATMDKCISLGGESLQDAQTIKSLLDHYIKNKDWEKVAILLGKLTAADPSDTRAWTDYARVLKQLGRMDEAISAAKKAAELDPALKTSAQKFIDDINKK